MKKLIETPGGKIAYCGMLTALAMIFSYVESLIPINFGVPGIKLGLANLVVLTGLYYLRPGEVLAVSVCRILRRRASELCGDAPADPGRPVFADRSEYRRRRIPQYGAAAYGYADSAVIRAGVLCAGTDYLRCADRCAHGDSGEPRDVYI